MPGLSSERVHGEEQEQQQQGKQEKEWKQYIKQEKKR